MMIKNSNPIPNPNLSQRLFTNLKSFLHTKSSGLPPTPRLRKSKWPIAIASRIATLTDSPTWIKPHANAPRNGARRSMQRTRHWLRSGSGSGGRLDSHRGRHLAARNPRTSKSRHGYFNSPRATDAFPLGETHRLYGGRDAHRYIRLSRNRIPKSPPRKLPQNCNVGYCC